MIKLLPHAFDPWQELSAFQRQTPHLAGNAGAQCHFIGSMREINQGTPVTRMWLEHYPGMTERELQQITQEACERWAVLASLIVHRVGNITPGEPIVLVAVWAQHRGDAFDACRYLMEALKSRAPFWKKETLASQATRWVSENSSGYA